MAGEQIREAELIFQKEIKISMLESIDRFILELDTRFKALNNVLETFSCVLSKILISGTSDENEDTATSICANYDKNYI